LEDLALLIVKTHLPRHLVENQWLKRFGLHLCPNVKKIIFKRNFGGIGGKN
jgi:hypothetical protein